MKNIIILTLIAIVVIVGIIGYNTSIKDWSETGPEEIDPNFTENITTEPVDLGELDSIENDNSYNDAIDPSFDELDSKLIELGELI